MAATTTGYRRVTLLILVLCAAAVVIKGAPQENQGDSRPRGRQTGWYSSRSRDSSRPYNLQQPSNNPNNEADGDDEPTFGTREDYGSRDPTYGAGRRRGRPTGAARGRPQQGGRGSSRRQQPGAYNRNQPAQTPPDTPYNPQPGFGGYDPRLQPSYDPQPPREQPRQPVFGGYDPRPQPDYNPRPQPDPPRQPVFGGYDPRPPQYPTDTWQRPPAPQPERSRGHTDDMLNLIPGGRYQGPGNLGGSGPKDFVIGEEGVLCAPTCRGHCIIRDTECNCVQNMTCFNEYKHRLDIPAPDILYQPPDCRTMECKDPCGYKVQWPDGWCMCDIDPMCAARPANNAYTKREADLDKLISQRDAHMAELKRASRHSQKTKRQADQDDDDDDITGPE